MSTVTKRLLVLFGVACSVLFFSSQVWAISLSFNPSASKIDVGAAVSIDLVISGMENNDLGYFEFNLDYDDSILRFDSYSLANGLGDIAALDADDWSQGNLGNGTINLAELSYLDDLSFQADSFTLATLSFTGTGEGTSALSYSDVVLSDELGNPLSADLFSGSVVVTDAVPEPATLLLFGTGLAGLLGFRRKFNN